jgi:hypothetical protein
MTVATGTPDDRAELAAAPAAPARRFVASSADRPRLADMVRRLQFPAAPAGAGRRAVAARADRPGVGPRGHPAWRPALRAVSEPAGVGVIAAVAHRPGR